MTSALFALDVLSFVSLAWFFVVLLFNAAVDPDKTIDSKSLELRDLLSHEKRTRFMWPVLASTLPLLTLLLHIILYFR